MLLFDTRGSWLIIPMLLAMCKHDQLQVSSFPTSWGSSWGPKHQVRHSWVIWHWIPGYSTENLVPNQSIQCNSQDALHGLQDTLQNMGICWAGYCWELLPVVPSTEVNDQSICGFWFLCMKSSPFAPAIRSQQRWHLKKTHRSQVCTTLMWVARKGQNCLHQTQSQDWLLVS